MKPVLHAAATLLAIVLMLALLRGPADPNLASTVEVLAQPEAAARLEAQRLEHERTMAEIAARHASEQAHQRTVRLALVLGALVVVSVGGAVAVGLSRRRTTVLLLPGSAEFERQLADLGGYYVAGQPYYEGQPVRYLEGE